MSTIYLNSLKIIGTRLIGIHFHYLHLWFPTNVYKTIHEWDEYDDISIWDHVEQILIYYAATKFEHVSYNCSNVHTSLL